MTMSYAAMTAAMKEFYDGQTVTKSLVENEPTFAMLAKKTNRGGKSYPVSIMYGNAAGGSADFATAQANIRAASLAEFQVITVDDYAVFRLTGKAFKASQGDKMAFMSAMSLQSDAALNVIKRSICSGLFRNGTGSLGRLNGGAVGAATVMLLNLAEIMNFEEGMRLVASAADGGAIRTGGVGGNSALLGPVDYDAGTLTTQNGNNWNDATNIGGADPIGVSDFLYRQGDAANGGANIKVSGFAAYIPLAAPGAALFFGVNRSLNPVRLGGSRFNAVGMPIAQALARGAARVGRNGMGTPDYAVVNHENYAALLDALGSKKEYASFKVADVGFDGVKVYYAGGVMEVYPDHNCQADRAFLLKKDCWALGSIGEVPHMADDDGLTVHQTAAADGIEGRWRYYAQLECDNPGACGVVQLA